MMKLRKTRWIALIAALICVMLVFSISVFPQESEASVTSREKGTEKDTAGFIEYERSIKRDEISLDFDTENFRFTVTNLTDGSVWKSYIEKDDIQSERPVTDRWLETMSSLVMLQYTNYKATSSVPSANSSVIKTVAEKDGVYTVSMDFASQQISMDVKIWVEDNALHFEIPGDSINEYGLNGVMQIDILPFMMSSQISDEGYILIPEGSGALFNFRSDALPYMNRRYIFNIYSGTTMSLGPSDFKDTNDEITTDLVSRVSGQITGNAEIPAMGIVKEGSAVLSFIMDGEADTVINMEPSGFAVDINRLFPTARYRYSYSDPRPEVAKMITYYESRLNAYDFHAQYIFLSGENADYSGMANECRNILVEDLGIQPRSGMFSGALSLFSGIIQDRILFDKFITSVTFEQAEHILEDIGVGNLVVSLTGSGEHGYNAYNARYSPSGKLGGTSGLESLIETARANGSRIFLEENFVEVFAETKKPSNLDRAYIRDANNMLISDSYHRQYIVNPRSSFDIFESRYIDSVLDIMPDGITFRRIGEVTYRDNARRNMMTFAEGIEAWRGFLSKSKEQLGGSAVQGGNLYVLGSADWVYNIPVEDTGCVINDEVVPFYQMVVHGLVDYSGQPGNLTHDFTYTKLKWVEFGCVPYFELTYSESEEIINKTNYKKLYSSTYELWAQDVKSTFEEYNGKLGQTHAAFMVRHERLSDGLVRIDYSNGVTVYINYDEEDTVLDGITVPGSDYSVIVPGEGSNVN